jgi:hypothetical protein
MAGLAAVEEGCAAGALLGPPPLHPPINRANKNATGPATRNRMI